MLRYRGGSSVIYTPDTIRGKLGIELGQYADFKSLTGDTADNIKGADKVGPKTAAALLGEFGTLEGILANAERIKKPSIRESIIRNAEKLRTNYKIIKLGDPMELPFEIGELAYGLTEITMSEVLEGIGLR